MSSKPPPSPQGRLTTPSPLTRSDHDSVNALEHPINAIPNAGTTTAIPFDDDDDLDMKERIQQVIKWVVILAGMAAALYFGGGVVIEYIRKGVQDQASAQSHQTIAALQSELDQLKSGNSMQFQVEVKEVQRESSGYAYLVLDNQKQPWFAQSQIAFPKGAKAWISIQPPHKLGDSPRVLLSSTPSDTITVPPIPLAPPPTPGPH